MACNPRRYSTVRRPRAAPAEVTEEVEMKRIIALLMLVIVAAGLATVGPVGAGAAFADNGVISSRD